MIDQAKKSFFVQIRWIWEMAMEWFGKGHSGFFSIIENPIFEGFKLKV